MGCAVLIEVYADSVATTEAQGARFAFVTHNTKDFSHPNANSNLPHPDIATCFSRVPQRPTRPKTPAQPLKFSTCR
jgi:hypothetical protein